MIKEYEVVRAFIRSDLECFPRLTINEKQHIIDKWWKQINNIKHKANFVVIKRISNLGLVEAELKVTQNPWTYDRNIKILLPPNPTINHTLHWTIVKT